MATPSKISFSSKKKEEEDNLTSKFYEERIITVDKGQRPIRIDKFLMDKVENITRNRVQKAIQLGTILVDDKSVKASFKVLPGQIVHMRIPRSSMAEEIIPQDIPLDVRYEDQDVLVIYKPAGLVVHPGYGNSNGTLINALAYYFGNDGSTMMNTTEEGYERPWLIHRIDKDTTGLMVIAKTELAMTNLSKQFFNRTIHRRYWAIVWGEPWDTEGTIIGNIGRHPTNRMQMTVHEDETEGKHAVTHYKVLERLYYVSLVECRLETGRTHQIRVHLKHIGHTLFNDSRYGGDKVLKGTVFTKYKRFVENCFDILPHQALHAKELGFLHPRTGEKMFFDSEPTDGFYQCLNRWRTYVEGRKNLLED
jgi:23S rRNA pseudouridine1911/1915/1917 synthase